MKAALTGGASNFAANEEERTGLSLACEREDWDCIADCEAVACQTICSFND